MNCFVSFYKIKSFKIIQFFSEAPCCVIERISRMTDQENKIKLEKVVFDDGNQERNLWSCLTQSCSRSQSVFLSQRFVILLFIYLVAFVQIIFQKLLTDHLFSWDFYEVQCDFFS